MMETVDEELSWLSLEDSDNATEDLLKFNIPNNASKYITDDKLNEFFQFQDNTALNVIHVNCRSLNKNFGSLNILLQSLSDKLLAIAVTETWLTESLQNAYNIHGYNLLTN